MKLLFVLFIIALANSLEFTNDGYFKIVQFTDLHYGIDYHSNDVLTAASQRAILDAESPDFVIITGDIVHGNSDPNPYDPESCLVKEKGYANCWNDAVSAMVERDIPWAVTLGNHDISTVYHTPEEIVNMDMAYSLSHTQLGPANISGATNYVLHVNGTKSQGLDLWFFDTRSLGCESNKDGYGCVDHTQIAWYRKESARRAKTGEGSPYGLIATHIPPPDTMDLANSDGLIFHRIKGHYVEQINCPLVNSGFVKAVSSVGNVQTLIYGHDHNNDFYGVHENVLLAYGRKSGYGCYGPDKPLVVGARVLQYHEGPAGLDMTTWIRNFDGSRTDQVHEKHTMPHQNVCY